MVRMHAVTSELHAWMPCFVPHSIPAALALVFHSEAVHNHIQRAVARVQSSVSMSRWAVAVEMMLLIGWLVTDQNEGWDAENEHLLDVIIHAIRS